MEISTRLVGDMKEIVLNGKLDGYEEYSEFKRILKQEIAQKESESKIADSKDSLDYIDSTNSTDSSESKIAESRFKPSGFSRLAIYFVNATSIDPYILGFILKLKERDKINLNIIVSNAKLYNFLHNIDFDTFFDIKIKEYE